MNALVERLSPAWVRLRTYDRSLLIIAAILLAVGILLSMAASPAATARIQIAEAFYFAGRQAAYAAAGAVVMLAAAALDPRGLRRAGSVIAVIALPLCALVAWVGPEVKGAQRWFDLGIVSLQPSELLKPALVVVWAWMLSEGMKAAHFPGRAICLALLAASAAALLAQPDIGQTALIALVLGMLFLLSGLKLRWLFGAAAAGAAALWGVYTFYPHARERLDGFMSGGEQGYQVGRALDAIAAGGVFGRGPGEGVVKRALPDAHADFVFAVAAEEFGLLASLGLIGAFGWLAFRGFSRASRLNDAFEQLAAAGLVALLVAQAGIHMAVNLNLLPAKGMTLPFISFGGSSMIGSALAFGFLLSLLRDRPGAFLLSSRPAS